jgi:hypothetical protein
MNGTMHSKRNDEDYTEKDDTGPFMQTYMTLHLLSLFKVFSANLGPSVFHAGARHCPFLSIETIEVTGK